MIGIVVDRCDTGHPWQDHRWQPSALLPDAPADDTWRLLEDTPGCRRWYAGALPLELFRGETAGYRENLLSARPAVWVVLRRGGGGHEVAPLLVTACPHEALSYTESGDDVVEALPMPDPVARWVQAFVERHHVETVFVKRQRSAKAGDAAPRPRAARLPEADR